MAVINSTFAFLNRLTRHDGKKQHRANNAEFGLDEEQGLFVWLIPVDNANRWFHMKDHWNLW